MNKKTLLVMCALLFAGGVFAQGADQADLKKTAAAPEIQKQLDQPDGAAVFLKADGSFQILARGTGTYDFDDVDDINDARQEATMKAKAALAKFMNEKLSTEESFASQSKQVKTITKDGKTETSNATKETAKTSAVIIKNSASALLKGTIILKEQKVPGKGSSGQIQVTVGVSSKTLQALTKLNQALSAQPEKKPAAVNNGGSNKAGIKEAVTDF